MFDTVSKHFATSPEFCKKNYGGEDWQWENLLKTAMHLLIYAQQSNGVVSAAFFELILSVLSTR